MIDAEIGAVGNIRAKGNIRDLKDIKFGRKKRSPGWFKKVWVSKAYSKKLFLHLLLQKKVVRNPIKKINRELIQRPIKKLKCMRLVRKTVGFNLVSNGVVKMGISLSLGNLSITEADGGMLLSFLPTFHIVGQVVSWNLDQVNRNLNIGNIITLFVLLYSWKHLNVLRELPG